MNETCKVADDVCERHTANNPTCVQYRSPADEARAVLGPLGTVEHHRSIPKVPYSQAHPCQVVTTEGKACTISQEEHHRLIYGILEENRELRQRVKVLEGGKGHMDAIEAAL